jgi:predicted RNA-binding Zn-ribbon protein involved in translation (DUF1610 family)
MAEDKTYKDELLEKLTAEVNKIVESKFASINDNTSKLETKKAINVVGYHPGQFQHDMINDRKEEIYCPNCGTFERRELPAIKEVVEKEIIPKGYIPQPQGLEDIVPYLEMKHQDGKTVFDCPSCSSALNNWLDNHITDLKKDGYEIKRVKK